MVCLGSGATRSTNQSNSTNQHEIRLFVQSLPPVLTRAVSKDDVHSNTQEIYAPRCASARGDRLFNYRPENILRSMLSRRQLQALVSPKVDKTHIRPHALLGVVVVNTILLLRQTSPVYHDHLRDEAQINLSRRAVPHADKQRPAARYGQSRLSRPRARDRENLFFLEHPVR